MPPETQPPEWLVEGFRELPSNPRVAIDNNFRPHSSQPIARAAIAFVAVFHIGLSSGQEVEDTLSAAELGYSFATPHLAGQWNNHPHLHDRIIAVVKKLPAPLSHDPFASVRMLVEAGDPEGAATLFYGLAEEQRDPNSRSLDARMRYDETSKTLRDWISSNVHNHDELASVTDALRQRLASASNSIDQLDDAISTDAAAKFASQYELASQDDARRSKHALWGAYLFFALALLSAFWFALHAFKTKAELNWPASAAHITISLAFLGLAGFTARLSREYRQAMWHWKHTALQLRMFFPFIETLGDESRSEAVLAMVPRFFPGQPDHPIREGDDAGIRSSDAALAEALVSQLSRATTNKGPMA